MAGAAVSESDLKQLDHLGARWYAVTRRFPSSEEARLAWERLNAEGRAQRGKLDLGVYRHATPGLFGDEADLVTAVGLRRKGVRVACRVLRGEPNPLSDELLHSMIERRVRVVAEQMIGKPGTHLVVRRPEGRGARLRPGGFIDERIGEDE